jgi:hypothetical protein
LNEEAPRALPDPATRKEPADPAGPSGHDSLLSLAEAGLRHAKAALAAARRIVELLPLDQETIIGSCCLATLAEIRIRLG